MPFEAVLAMLNLIVDKLEDISIERDSYSVILLRAGFTQGELDRIAEEAKSDPAIRSRIHQAFAETRQRLEEAGISPLLGGLSGEIPPPDKQNSRSSSPPLRQLAVGN